MHETRDGDSWDTWAIWVSIVLTLVVFLFYLLNFGCGIHSHIASADPEKAFDLYEKFGQFGDYFGGVLNPILAFINMGLLIYYQKTLVSISIQKDDFFRMLEIQRQLTSEITISHFDKDKGCQITYSGQLALHLIAGHVQVHAHKLPNTTSFTDRLKESYEKVWSEGFLNESLGQVRGKALLGHYFRSLYHIFKLLLESNMPHADRIRLAKIARAQLSQNEQRLLFCNCLTEQGERFQVLVGQFELLEFLEDSDFDTDSEKLTAEVTLRVLEWKKAYKSLMGI